MRSSRARKRGSWPQSPGPLTGLLPTPRVRGRPDSERGRMGRIRSGQHRLCCFMGRIYSGRQVASRAPGSVEPSHTEWRAARTGSLPPLC